MSMKRILDFSGGKGPKRFELCYNAILSFGDQKGGRGREVIRKEARLLDALDSISVASGEVGQSERILLTTELVKVQVGEEDHALLVEYVDKTPWLPKVSREVVDCQDFLSSAEKVE